MTTETAKSLFAGDGHPCFKYKLNDPKAFWNGAGTGGGGGGGGGIGVGGGGGGVGGIAGNVLQATASTERFWEEEPEEEIKRKVQDAKIKFHRDRQLQVKHLPRNVTEEVSERFNFVSNTRVIVVLYSKRNRDPSVQIVGRGGTTESCTHRK